MEIRTMVEVTDQERQVLELMRGITYGELSVFMKGGNPYRVETRKSIQISLPSQKEDK